MADVSMSSIQFKVEYDTKQAEKSIKELSNSLSKLSKNTNDLKKLTTAFNSLAEGTKSFGQLANALSKFNNVKISRTLGDNLKNISSGLKTIKDSDISKANNLAKALSKFNNVSIPKVGTTKSSGEPDVESTSAKTTSTVDSNKTSMASIKGMFTDGTKYVEMFKSSIAKVQPVLSTIGRGALSVGKHIGSAFGNRVVGSIKKVTGAFNTLGSSLAKIAFYRVIRSVIKAITSAFSEGISNVYAYSDAIGGQLASSLDRLATAGQYLTNSLGAMASPIINALAPAIDWLIDKFVDLLNIINQVFARLGGATSWTKAIKGAKKWGDTTASSAGRAKQKADELKRTILGFDEINKLNDNNESSGGSGSGSGADTDFGSMFEEVSIDNSIADLVDKFKQAISNGDWQEAGKLLGSKINTVMDDIDWDGVGTKLGYGFNGAIQTWYYFVDTINFTKLAIKLGGLINSALEQVDFTYAGRILVQKFTVIGELLVGAVYGINWSLLGESIGEFVIGAFDEVSSFVDQYDWFSVGQAVYRGLVDLVTGIDFGGVATSLATAFGKALGGIGALLTGAISGLSQDLVDYFKQYIVIAPDADWLEIGVNIIGGICKGVIDAIANIGQWIIDNIFTPFINGFKSAFEIHSPSKVMQEMGQFLMEGVLKGINDRIDSVVKKITDFAKGVKDKVFETWNNVKEKTSTVWGNITSTVGGKVDKIKTDISTGFETAKKNAIDKFDDIKGKIVGKMEDARNKISGIVDKIKGFFSGMSLSFPHIKLPHFRIQPSGWSIGDLLKGSIPSLGIDWYAKGGIMQSPTMFGMNGSNAMVGGERGAEAILPLEGSNSDIWLNKVADRLSDKSMNNDNSQRELIALQQQQIELLQGILSKDTNVSISTSEITDAFKRKNRREGKTVVAVG